jgi:segregation and condensation protein B
MMGRRDLPGRPIIYGTTKAFLEIFSLNTLSDLPTLKEIQPLPGPEEVPKEEILKIDAEEATSHEVLPTDEVKQ